MHSLFSNPLGLLALAALPAIAILHLFRRRFRPQLVSALFLWAPEDRTLLAGRKRDPLRRSASLWLELAAALCLALALAGPRSCGSSRAEHLIAVLDGSVSMSAPQPKGSASEQALAELERRIDALPSAARVTLIESSARPRVLAGPAASLAEARAALDAYAPRGAHHDPRAAFELAQQVAGDARVLWFSDALAPQPGPESAPDAEGEFRPPPNVECRALGSARDNIGFTRAERVWVERGDEQRVLLTVQSFARMPVRAKLALRARPALAEAQGAALAERELELAPDEQKLLSFALPAGAPPIEARLELDAPSADWEIDNRAFLAPPPERVLGLASALSPEDARALGLSSPRAEAPLAPLLDLIPRSSAAADAEHAQLLIAAQDAPAAGTDWPAPPGGPTTWVLLIERPMGGSRALLGPFLADRTAELLGGLTWQGVLWSAQDAVHLPGQPLVFAGNLPLVAAEDLGQRSIVRLNLDPARSTFARSPDWPILLTNLAELRRAELPGLARATLGAGEPLRYRGEREGLYALVPHGIAGAERLELRAGALLEWEAPERPGLWTLEQDGQALATLGVNFADPFEADLRTRGAGERAAQGELALAEADASLLALVLAALALAAALGDWWVLHTRQRGA